MRMLLLKCEAGQAEAGVVWTWILIINSDSSVLINNISRLLRTSQHT